MRCEAGVEKCRQPDLIDMLFEIGIAEGADILACRALRGIVEQCFLEEERMRRVGDDQPRDAVRVLERGHPRDRTTPIVAGPSEAIDHEMVGEGEQVRSEERRIGEGCVSTCRSWWSRDQ